MNLKVRVVSIMIYGVLSAANAAAPAAAAAPATPPVAAPSEQNPAAATPAAATPAAATPAAAAAPDAPPAELKTLDQEVQSLKKDVIDLNKDLFVLQEELLFPANTQVALYISMDVGTFFALDSVTVKIDNKEVKNYLYTAREADALLKGGVQQIYLGNLKVGKHELVAFFTGKGPVERAYKRGATISFDKGVGAKYLELKITDRVPKHQPEFMIKDWE
ncbi:MAG: AraC family transcriptional regulator [Steroidobacteraceae bacterium]